MIRLLEIETIAALQLLLNPSTGSDTNKLHEHQKIGQIEFLSTTASRPQLPNHDETNM